MKFAKIVNLLKPFLFLASSTVLAIPTSPTSYSLKSRQDDPNAPCAGDEIVGGPPRVRALSNESSLDTHLQKRGTDGVRFTF